jgi:hypothetical protein
MLKAELIAANKKEYVNIRYEPKYLNINNPILE